MSSVWTSACDRVERICASQTDLRSLRTRVLDELSRVLRFDAYAWVLTDPVTCVGAAPMAQIPRLSDLPQLIRLKYLTSVNRWTSLPDDRAVTLAEETGGQLDRSRLWRDLLHDYGVVDVASMVFRDGYGCWGFLDLWRSAPSLGAQGGATPDGSSRMPTSIVPAPFTPEERSFLTLLVRPVTHAVRAGVATTFASAAAEPVQEPVAGPVVLMLAPDLRLLAQTPSTDAYLRTLLPPGEQVPPVPAAAYNVAAQLLALEEGVDAHPPAARVHLSAGRWLTLRAARLPAASDDAVTPGPGAAAPPTSLGPTPRQDAIAVSIDVSTPSDRAEVFGAAHGLTPREAELLHLLLTGADTRHLARRMSLSEHTVQDHLKSMFAKTGTHSRPMLVARVVGR
jgi:DNA-binding CsgD family transcriptional regulator